MREAESGSWSGERREREGVKVRKREGNRGGVRGKKVGERECITGDY